MVITADAPFRSQPRISRGAFVDLLFTRAAASVAEERPPGSYWDAITGYGLDPLFLLAMFSHESSMGKAGTATITHSWGNTRRPTFGVQDIGVTPGRSGEFPIFRDWMDGCRSTCARLVEPTWVYAGRTSIREIFEHPSGKVWAPAGDLNNPAGYLRAVLDFMNAHADGGTAMAAPEIVRNILPWQASNTPGKTMVWDSITVHNTGNPSPGADAIMHGRWLQSLAKAGASEPSWQYTVDDTRIVQHLEDTQAGWHASDGDGPGNMQSLGFELCEIGDQNKVIANAAWIIARKLHSKGLGTDMVFQHHDRARDKKNCPRLLRANNGAGWKKLLSLIDAELAALGGGSSSAPTTKKWVIPDNPYGEYGFVLGFRTLAWKLAMIKHDGDLNASILSITGYPLGEEYPTATGAAQSCERCILLYDRNAQPPFDVTLAFRNAPLPPRKDGE